MNCFLQRGWCGLLFSLLGLALAFGVYFVLYLARAMGAGDVKLMAAVGALLGWQNWFGVFVITAILGGVMALIVAVAKKRLHKTLWNVAYILDEMKHGRPAYLNRQELDVKNPNAMGLPHGAVIAVGCMFFLALSARLEQ
jgi:prepilin peptidase CpaA